MGDDFEVPQEMIDEIEQIEIDAQEVIVQDVLDLLAATSRPMFDTPDENEVE